MWKPINKWEDLYSVNENGEVKNNKTNKIIVGDINSCGYYRVCLYDKQNNRKQRFFRHRLVAIHFIDNPNNYDEVNHIDGNKSNNNVNNLEWVNRVYNERHSKKKLYNNKEYKPFKVIYLNGEERIYDFKKDLAEKLGVTESCVKNYLHKITKGYIKYGIISIEYI